MALTIKEKGARQWAKNKANAYPCPDCGKIINKTIVYRHKESYFHKYHMLLNASKLATTPVLTTESGESISAGELVVVSTTESMIDQN